MRLKNLLFVTLALLLLLFMYCVNLGVDIIGINVLVFIQLSIIANALILIVVQRKNL